MTEGHTGSTITSRRVSHSDSIGNGGQRKILVKELKERRVFKDALGLWTKLSGQLHHFDKLSLLPRSNNDYHVFSANYVGDSGHEDISTLNLDSLPSHFKTLEPKWHLKYFASWLGTDRLCQCCRGWRGLDQALANCVWHGSWVCFLHFKEL